MFHKENKTELFTLGFICVLHIFGHDLKWNPHIHCLLSEGGIEKSGFWRSYKHFNYNRHEDEKLIFETITVMEFIQRLIQHSPEKHFKQIRYYGLYARTKEPNKKLNLAISRKKHKILLSFNRWRDCILHSFGYDPLKCPYYGQTMVFLKMYHNHQHISLNEMYERAMAKFHASSA